MKNQEDRYMCFVDYSKRFDSVDHTILWAWTIVGEIGIPKHLVLLVNFYRNQEATVRTDYGNSGWFGIGKGVGKRCILPAHLFNLYSDAILRNACLDEAKMELE